MNVHWLQHVPFEGPAGIADWCQTRSHQLKGTHLYRDPLRVSCDDFDFLVIMGGPMGANDDHKFPWMAEEKRLIRDAINAGKIVLGVCLGAQLIADALGAKVYKNREKEIGWMPITLDPSIVDESPLSTMPQNSPVFHWHGDTFDLPAGATHLAASEACENQAFSFQKHILGLQFHIEVGVPQIEALLQFASNDLTPGSFVQTPERIRTLSAQYANDMPKTLFAVLDALTQAPSARSTRQ